MSGRPQKLSRSSWWALLIEPKPGYFDFGDPTSPNPGDAEAVSGGFDFVPNPSNAS